jgi:hypothetical protein
LFWLFNNSLHKNRQFFKVACFYIYIGDLGYYYTLWAKERDFMSELTALQQRLMAMRANTFMAQYQAASTVSADSIMTTVGSGTATVNTIKRMPGLTEDGGLATQQQAGLIQRDASGNIIAGGQLNDNF